MLKLGITFLLVSLAWGSSHIPVRNPVTVTDEKGHEVELDASFQVSFDIEEVGDVTSMIRLYNFKGEEAGLYSIPAKELQEILNKRLQSGITEITKGPEGKQPGCCDVNPPEKPGRDLAIVENPPIVAVGTKPVKPKPVAPKPTVKPKPVPEEPAPESPAAQESPVEKPAAGICGLYQKFKSLGVPDEALKQALSYYQKNPKKIANKNVISIANYSVSSRKERFYILDMKKGTVHTDKVSHGGGSKPDYIGDRNHDGMLDRCKRSNGVRTDLTRAGFFTTGQIGFSPGKNWPNRKVKPYKNPKGGGVTKYQNFMQLVSRSPGVNDDAYGYVMHEAPYNHPGNAIMGRSHGCPAFVKGEGFPVWDQIQGGSLYYSYAPVCKDDHKKVLNQIPEWKNFCQ